MPPQAKKSTNKSVFDRSINRSRYSSLQLARIDASRELLLGFLKKRFPDNQAVQNFKPEMVVLRPRGYRETREVYEWVFDGDRYNFPYRKCAISSKRQRRERTRDEKAAGNTRLEIAGEFEDKEDVEALTLKEGVRKRKLEAKPLIRFSRADHDRLKEALEKGWLSAVLKEGEFQVVTSSEKNEVQRMQAEEPEGFATAIEIEPPRSTTMDSTPAQFASNSFIGTTDNYTTSVDWINEATPQEPELSHTDNTLVVTPNQEIALIDTNYEKMQKARTTAPVIDPRFEYISWDEYQLDTTDAIAEMEAALKGFLEDDKGGIAEDAGID